MEEATITSKGQIVIPARLRRRFGLKAGTKVRFIEHGNEILFQPVTKEYIRNLCGMLTSETLVTKELLRERAKDGEHEEAQFEKRRAR
jgi:AbrB family looped-hinge helix DNA binding protein